MISKIFKLVVLLAILISCTNSSKNNTSFFNSKIDYKKAETVQTFTLDNIYQPQVMKVIGNKLLISDTGGESAFHVLKIEADNSITYLNGVGRQGRGPGEFTRLMDFVDADSIIYVYDGSQLKLVGYDVDLNFLTDEEINLNTLGMASSFYSVTQDKFLAVGLFFDDRFQTYDSKGEITGQFGDIIPIKESFTKRDNALAWRSFGAVNPEGTNVYLFSANADRIEMYSTEGELLKTIKSKENPVPKMDLDESGWPVDNGGVMAYEGLDNEDEYLYGFYSGAKRSSFKPGSDNLFEQMEFNKIHKLDWDLNLIEAFELDHIPSSFAVGENGGMFTLSQTDEGTVIRYVDLK
ncbi:MAG: 6-bladed beta-propeller [Balneola sp.]